ncbi:hypothetical protein PLCT2_02961 [Planctomycetaceae bacterium]|nr:hypothetical protein PLCT2_02961 [Planctomycetaceae bacterium]
MTSARTPHRVKVNIDKVLSALIERGVVDDQNFAILRQPSAEVWEVSFDGAEHVSLAMGDIDYSEIHTELSLKRSFSAKLIDGGLLQLMYLFNEERLVRHRLAFYPSPSRRPFQEDPNAYLRDELFLDIVSRRIVPFPVRLDFDAESATDVIHPMCHLTMGDVKGCRIPVSAPLSPRWFTEFVLRNFYQTETHDLIGCLPGHDLNFADTITINEQRLIHLVVPRP